MKNLDVQHYLDIYTVRKEMQELGITNPREEIKEFVKEFVLWYNNLTAFILLFEIGNHCREDFGKSFVRR